MAGMQSIKDILLKFDPIEDKYISREFQSFGVHLANKLGDDTHKSLYIRLAKTIPRPVLEQALRFVVDSKAKNKGALFMWKIKEMGGFQKAVKTPATGHKRKRTGKKEEKKDSGSQVREVQTASSETQKAEKPKKTAKPYRSSRARKADLPDPLF